jgi:hypothetical protein
VVLGAAFLGAVVGGPLTMVATIVVARRELTRSARIRLYDDDLPALFGSTVSEGPTGRRSFPTPNWRIDAYRQQVERTATIAGRRTTRRARRVLGLMEVHDGIARDENEELHAVESANRRDRAGS